MYGWQLSNLLCLFIIHFFHEIQVATVEVLKVQKLCDTIWYCHIA